MLVRLLYRPNRQLEEKNDENQQKAIVHPGIDIVPGLL